MSDIIQELLKRAAAQASQGDLWLTREEWGQLRAMLSGRSPWPGASIGSDPEGATIFGMPIRISIDYLTEVVKAYAPEEE